MNRDSSFPPNSSLNALRGAVGGVVGAADTVGCWDQCGAAISVRTRDNQGEKVF